MMKCVQLNTSQTVAKATDCRIDSKIVARATDCRIENNIGSVQHLGLQGLLR
jgi:hypothetical protein